MNKAFTLIELLVVITIIVVLLALLTPALDKAIYQAELVVCGSNHKAIASGANTYAMAFGRKYPDRYLWTPEVIAAGTLAEEGGEDDRPKLRPYLSMNAFGCPLASDLDYNQDDPNSTDAAFIASSSVLYFGWQYSAAEGGLGGAGMFKLGDRWAWNGMRFNVLAADASITVPGGFDSFSAHPDQDGVFTQIEYDFEPAPVLPGSDISPAGFNFLMGGWFGTEAQHDRGAIDMNAVFADGSVARYTEVDDDQRENAPVPVDQEDERMAHVNRNNGEGDSFPDEYILVPRR